MGLMRRGRYGENPLLPYLFILPHLIFFMIFIGFATMLGFWISLHKFDFLQPVHPFKLQRVFNNRHVENLFREYGSMKFFLGRDNIREVLVLR